MIPVGHSLHAGSYDRKALEAIHRAQVRWSPGCVGIEVGVSLIEAELAMAWYARLGTRQDPVRRSFAVSKIRGLVTILQHLKLLMRGKRKFFLPITRGR